MMTKQEIMSKKDELIAARQILPPNTNFSGEFMDGWGEDGCLDVTRIYDPVNDDQDIKEKKHNGWDWQILEHSILQGRWLGGAEYKTSLCHKLFIEWRELERTEERKEQRAKENEHG